MELILMAFLKALFVGFIGLIIFGLWVSSMKDLVVELEYRNPDVDWETISAIIGAILAVCVMIWLGGKI